MIKLETKAFKKYLKILEKGVINKKSSETLPDLRNILIIIENNEVKLRTNNLKMIIEITLKEDEFILENIEEKIIEIAINVDFIKNFVKNFQEKFIEINDNTIDNTIDFLINENCISKFKKEYVDTDKITYPKYELKNTVKINANRFKEMLERTIKFVSKDEGKPVLTGQLLEIEKNKLNIVAIDGFRVANQIEKIDNIFDNNIKCIITQETSNLLSKIINKKLKLENIQIDIINKEQTNFKYDNIIILAKNIDGEYIQYEQIFHNDYEKNIIVNKDELLNSIKMISSLIENKRKFPVILEIKNDNLLLFVKNNNKKDKEYIYKNNINIIENNSLDNFIIGFNAQYLLEILENIEEKQIKLIFTSSLSPTIIEEQKYRYLCLPVKINND